MSESYMFTLLFCALYAPCASAGHDTVSYGQILLDAVAGRMCDERSRRKEDLSCIGKMGTIPLRCYLNDETLRNILC